MSLVAEERAYRAMVDLLKQADECRRLFHDAGMSAPEPLRRLYETDDAEDYTERVFEQAKAPCE